MALKFSHKTHKPYRPSILQKKQWAQFAVIGYSIAIRGYLRCWQGLLKAAGFEFCYLEAIDRIIIVSQETERYARWKIKHIKELQ